MLAGTLTRLGEQNVLCRMFSLQNVPSLCRISPRTTKGKYHLPSIVWLGNFQSVPKWFSFFHFKTSCKLEDTFSGKGALNPFDCNFYLINLSNRRSCLTCWLYNSAGCTAGCITCWLWPNSMKLLHEIIEKIIEKKDKIEMLNQHREALAWFLRIA